MSGDGHQAFVNAERLPGDIEVTEMKVAIVSITIFLISLFTCGCNFLDLREKEAKPSIEELSLSNMDPIAGTGIDAVDLAKYDLLEAIPWMAVNPEG